MSQPVPSPTASRLARPGWLDVRLVAGVLLVLLSVVVGARVLASADRTSLVWVLARDLAVGSTISTDDLNRLAVRLEDADQRYVTAPEGAAPPVGYVLMRGLGAGELLPRAALRLPGTGEGLRDVTVPVEAGHLPPDLRAGQLVDVYLTLGRDTDEQRSTRLLLSSVAVKDRSANAQGAGGDAAVLSVGPADAQTLVAALRSGTLDLVRVPEDAELARLTPATVTGTGRAGDATAGDSTTGDSTTGDSTTGDSTTDDTTAPGTSTGDPTDSSAGPGDGVPEPAVTADAGTGSPPTDTGPVPPATPSSAPEAPSAPAAPTSPR